MTRLHSVEFGTDSENTPLVLLGSLGSDSEMWLPQLDYFSHTRRVIALDHRGHGNSPILKDPADISDFAGDVLETLDALGVSEFDVVGLSLGGAVAQWLSKNSDRVRRTVLMCTAAKFGEPEGWQDRAATARSEGVSALSDAIIDRWFSPSWLEANPASRAHYRAMIDATDAEGYAAACDALSRWDFHAELGDIDKPVLVIAGTEDPSTAPEVVRLIADGIPGAKYEELSPAAHLPNLEQADKVNELIDAHLSE